MLSLLFQSERPQRALGDWIENKNELREIPGRALSWAEHVLPQQVLNIRDVRQEMLLGLHHRRKGE